MVDVVGGGAAAQQDDGHAARVASQALAALVPAWRAAGRPDAELVAAVAAGLPAAAPHRRRPLVSAVLDALPQASIIIACAPTALRATMAAVRWPGIKMFRM